MPAATHIGRTVREVLGDLADQIEPLYRRVIEQGQPIADVEVRRGDYAGPEAERVWLASYHPVKNEQGAVLGVSAVVQEITARKRVEETHLKLAHASRLATVGELTAMVVHELSQPLSAMLCNARAAEMMLENSNSPPLGDLHEIMGDIQRDNRRASESVQRMRTLLRQRRLEFAKVSPQAFERLIERQQHRKARTFEDLVRRVAYEGRRGEKLGGAHVGRGVVPGEAGQ